MSENNSNNTQTQQNTNQPNSNVQVQPAGSNDNAIAALGYLIFFVPLLVEPKTEFKTFHANQGLLLLIFMVGGSIVSAVLTVILIGAILWPLLMLYGFVVGIMGIVNALNGKKARLPLIGQWDLLK
jgi:uncharacterized membrane protein